MENKFTKEHEEKLDKLIAKAVKENRVFNYGLGQGGNTVINILNTVSTEGLRKILSTVKKLIQTEEDKDEWSSKDVDSKRLERLREDRELVNLAIGYKIKIKEIAANTARKAELLAKREELKKSTMTPEDLMKEIDAELVKLEEF